MNKDDYFEYHKDFCERMQIVTTAKNADYTGDTDDPFANFTAVERQGTCSTEQGFLVRMTDKMQRINSFVQKGVLEVEDEKVEDTLMDLANYCILFSGYLKGKSDDRRIEKTRRLLDLEDREIVYGGYGEKDSI